MGEKRMTPQQREDWIEAYLERSHESASVDVLSREFTDDYLDATQSAFNACMYGAHKIPQLGRDLARMASKGVLVRSRAGISDGRYLGFPTWVWSYRLNRPVVSPAHEAGK